MDGGMMPPFSFVRLLSGPLSGAIISRMIPPVLSRTPAQITVARLLSVIVQLSTVIIPVLALFNGLRESDVTLLHWLITCGVTVTCTTTLPALLFLLMLRRGMIANLHVSRRGERPRAYAVMILCYLVGTMAARAIGAPHRTVLLMAAVALCMLIGGAVNQLLFKLSMHTMIATLAGVTLILVYGAVCLPILILPGAVAWARIALREHTWPEVAVGAIAGSLVAMLVFVH
jgi:hypothetical protein